MDEAALLELLRQLDPAARDELRRLLIRDHRTRDATAERLLRHRTARARDLADLIDMLSLDDAARRRVARLLGQLEAEG